MIVSFSVLNVSLFRCRKKANHSIMSTPSAKTGPTGGKTTTQTTTVVKTTTTTTTVKQAGNTRGAGSKVTKPKTSASGKKVINSHSNRALTANGLMRFSRGRMFQRRALHRIGKWKEEQTKKTAGSIQKKKKQPKLALKKKPVGGDRNGKERLVRSKRFVNLFSFVRSSVIVRLFSLVIIQRKIGRRNSP